MPWTSTKHLQARSGFFQAKEWLNGEGSLSRLRTEILRDCMPSSERRAFHRNSLCTLASVNSVLLDRSKKASDFLAAIDIAAKNVPEKSTLRTDNGVNLNFQRDLGAIGPFEFQEKFVWTDPCVPCFQGKSVGTNGLQVRQKSPQDWH